MKGLDRAAWCAWGLAWVAFGSPALLYLPVAESWSARLVVLAVLGALSSSAALLRAQRRSGAGLALFSLACGALALLRTPNGNAEGEVRSVYTASNPYPRYSLANVIPEINQMKFGSYLAPAVDPLLTTSSASSVRALTVSVYRAMDAEPAFLELGSAMSYAYDDRDSGHLYAYIPRHSKTERLGALVFLHRSAGNFKVYTHLVASVAERERLVLVAPSFGFGHWQHDGGTAAAERARRYAVDVLGADPDRVVLAALANGGRGLTRVLAERVEAYRAVVALSAVLEVDVIDTVAIPPDKTLPALVVYGLQDDRIPSADEVEAAAALMRAGLRVSTHAYEGEDHFLFFSRRTEVLALVGEFLHGALAR